MKQVVIPILAALVMLSTTVVSAQPGPGPGRKMIEQNIEAQHAAFITQKLNLTPEESAAFWPIYNEFRAKEKALREEARPDERPANLTEEEAEELIEKHMNAEEKVLALRREYIDRFKTAIPPTKIVRLRMAEEAFKMELLERLRERRRDQMDNRN